MTTLSAVALSGCLTLVAASAASARTPLDFLRDFLDWNSPGEPIDVKYQAPREKTKITWEETCGGEKVTREATFGTALHNFVSITVGHDDGFGEKTTTMKEFALCNQCGAWSIDPDEFVGFFPLKEGNKTTFTRRSGAVTFNDTLRVVGSGHLRVINKTNGKEAEESHPVFVVVHSSVPFAGDKRTETTMWVSEWLNWPLKYERWANDGVPCRFSKATKYEPPPEEPKTAQVQQPAAAPAKLRRSETREPALRQPLSATRTQAPMTPGAASSPAARREPATAVQSPAPTPVAVQSSPPPDVTSSKTGGD